MKKNLFYLAVPALLLAACAQDDEQVSLNSAGNSPENAVLFDTYVPRTTTRATYGDITNEALKNSADGFGVFAYYTDNTAYTRKDNSGLNFMVNQRVRWDAEAKLYPAQTELGGWTYSPVKYWPNEFGATAAAEETDKLTFFAYAPYTPYKELGKEETGNEYGITALDMAGVKLDPVVVYKTNPDPRYQVDLLWGVVPATGVTTNDDEIQEGVTLTAGLPWIDVTKQKVSRNVTFDFKHALSKITLGTVQALVDETAASGNELDSKTKIYVREVRIYGQFYPIASEGYLDLNNTADESYGGANLPYWVNTNSSNVLGYTTPNIISASTAKLSDITNSDQATFTFYDGINKAGSGDANTAAYVEKYDRIDVIEGTELTKDYYVTSHDTEYASLNPDIIQGGNGVTEVKVPLLRSAWYDKTNNIVPAAKGFYFIPLNLAADNEEFGIQIVYDVETKDSRLTDKDQLLTDGSHGSKVRNVIFKNLPKEWRYDAGKCYTINMQIGMTSVKFDAQVTDWTNADTTEDFPINAN